MTNKQPSDADWNSFQAIDPWKSEHLTVKRRNLPHLAAPGATYFITFRSNTELSAAARDSVFATIRSCNQESIDLDAAVVMPEHAHLIIRLIVPYQLSQALQRIKGKSARQINQMLKSQGSVWNDESFDHIIRHAEELAEKLDYIRQNPVKRGLVAQPDGYRWLFIKSSTG